jgi:hypothetical protein
MLHKSETSILHSPSHSPHTNQGKSAIRIDSPKIFKEGGSRGGGRRGQQYFLPSIINLNIREMHNLLVNDEEETFFN